MWCVLYTGDGNEKKTEEFVTGLLPGDFFTRCFSLTRRRLYKRAGHWRTIQEKLLPGYVFIETEYPEAVYQRLEETPQNLLFSNQHHVSVLDNSEAAFIEQVTDQRGTVGISDIRIGEDREIQYLSGPLTRVSSRIKKVNLHKRVAEVGLNVSGKQQTLWLGVRF